MKHTTIHQALQELTSFVGISTKNLTKADRSDITTNNNQQFREYWQGWIDGVYDEDPGILVDNIINLLP